MNSRVVVVGNASALFVIFVPVSTSLLYVIRKFWGLASSNAFSAASNNACLAALSSSEADAKAALASVTAVSKVVNTGNVIVRALVPLANMFGYATDLRSNTQGRGTFSMEFKCYEQVPANIEKEIISKSASAE